MFVINAYVYRVVSPVKKPCPSLSSFEFETWNEPFFSDQQYQPFHFHQTSIRIHKTNHKKLQDA